MIEDSYIAQLGKLYKTHLKNIIAGNAFQPVVLRGGKNRPRTTVELHAMVAEFQKHDKRFQPNGWHIEWEEWTSKVLGKQQWPALIKVDTEDDFLFLLNRQSHCSQFKAQMQTLIEWRPEVRDLLFHHPEWVLNFKNEWPGIIAVADYLLANDVSHHYLRSLPVPVHTKFISDNKAIILSLLQYLSPERFPSGQKDIEEVLLLQKKPYLFTIRWLDADLAKTYTAGIDVLGIASERLAQADWSITQVILVENETNLYLLPPMQSTLAICSSGKALHLLKEIFLFKHSRLYYWGDLDEDGFKMLNDVRALYPHILSLFMDDITVRFHEAEMRSQNNRYKITHLPLLQIHEQKAFELMRDKNGRIEQEQLQQKFVAIELEKIREL